ncbi:RNA polymerase sigma factor [Achromobacter aloeverae]
MTGSRPPRKGWLAHYGELVSAWRRKGPGEDDGEDALQDSALGLLENGVAAIQGNPRAYLARSTRNGLIDRHRRRAKLAVLPIDEVDETDLPRTDSPESTLYAQELAGALMAALEELPLKCQQVYVHHRLEGRTQAEIADHMGLSRSMVEKYMQRAVRHIAERLQAYAPH